MARVTFINSILSGKLAGMVFANNKAGEYVRQYKKGTDPATVAQLNNRASFAAVSSNWHSLSDAQKAVWNTFAISNFKPKTGSPGVRFTGFNAFVSLNNVVANLNAKAGGYTITAPATITNTPGNFVPNADAPIHPLSGFIKTSAGAPMQLVMTSCALNAVSGECTASFNLIGPSGPGPVTSAPVFQDSVSGVEVGIAIVASLPIQQNQMFVANPDINLVAIIQPPGTLTGWTTGSAIEFSCNATNDYLARKLGYDVDQIVQFKAYLVAENGMTQPLGAIKQVTI